MTKILLKNYLRRLVQIWSLLLFFYLLNKTEFPVPDKLPVNIYFRMDALMAISTTLNSLYFSEHFLPALFLLIFIIIFGNFFCFWICPLGGMIDLGNMFLRKKGKFSIKISSNLRKTKFFILAGILIFSFLGFFLKQMPYIAWLFDPFVILTRAVIFKREWLVVLVIILLSSLFITRFWCNNFCPLGVLYYIFGIQIHNLFRRVCTKEKNEKKRIS